MKNALFGLFLVGLIVSIPSYASAQDKIVIEYPSRTVEVTKDKIVDVMVALDPKVDRVCFEGQKSEVSALLIAMVLQTNSPSKHLLNRYALDVTLIDSLGVEFTVFDGIEELDYSIIIPKCQ